MMISINSTTKLNYFEQWNLFLVPPTEVHITNLDGDKLNSVSSSVDELSEVFFVCLTSSANPVPFFSWRLNNQAIPQHLSTSLSMLWQQQQKQKDGQTAKSLILNGQSIATTLTNHRQQIAKLNKDDQINNDQNEKQNSKKDRKKNKNFKFKNNIDNSNNENGTRNNAKNTDDYDASPAIKQQTSIQSNTFATINYISPAELTTTTGSVLSLRNLTRSDIDSVLTCSASHPLYPHPINGSIKLDINCKFFVFSTIISYNHIFFLIFTKKRTYCSIHL